MKDEIEIMQWRTALGIKDPEETAKKREFILKLAILELTSLIILFLILQ